MEEYVTTAEVARRLRLSEETIRRWCRRGRLPSVQIGRAHRIPLQAVLEFTGGAWPAEEPAPAAETPEKDEGLPADWIRPAPASRPRPFARPPTIIGM